MIKVYIPNFFDKELKDKALLKSLLSEIKKHAEGANNLVDLYSPGEGLKVLKAYLFSKKIRIAILLRVNKGIYIPFFVAKKESRAGWNLSKYSEEMLLSKILKANEDIKQKKYVEYELPRAGA